MKVDVIASETHYLRHLMPIWAELPDHLRGDVYPLFEPGQAQPPRAGRLALVAGWQDVAPLRGRCDMVYVEHGAGQTYSSRPHDPSYSGSGGQRHRGVIGYIAPNETVAARWSKPAAAVGSPKLDWWLRMGVKPRPERPVICFAWHWDCRFVPEARSAWPHYAARFGEVAAMFAAQGFIVAGHAHPKWRGALDPVLAEFGVRVFPDEDHVFRYADILAVDNSSLGMEFLALKRPVVWLNAPWYRREVHHGGRFWDWTIGMETVDDTDRLLHLNLWDTLDWRGESLIDPYAAGQHHVRRTFAHTDGYSAKRAATFIASLIDGV